nr:tetratricopeptide repeat protein [uncultured Caldimonas sp.]
MHLGSLMRRGLPCLVLACAAHLPARADDAREVHALLQAGKTAEAMLKVEQALTRQPNSVQLRFLKGVVLTEQKKTPEAVAQFSQLIQDHPTLPEPYNNLAVLYSELGQYDKARIALEMAVRANPGYAAAYENLGDVYAKLAGEAYSKALQSDASNKALPPKLALIRELLAAPPAR